MSKKTWNDIETVPSLSSWPASYVRGALLKPKPYRNKNNDKEYDAESDKSLFGIARNGEMIIKTLSRDECDRQTFTDPDEVRFQATPNQSLPYGTTLSW